MQAGQLRHQVALQSNTPTRNDSGELVESWSTWATVWASVEPLDGREFFNAQQVTSEVTTRIRMRYRDGVTPQLRVAWRSRIYQIHAVIRKDERDREIHLMCSEVQS